MDLTRYADLFLTESREHLSAMNHLLLALERAPRATEPVAGLFRAVHTVKGMSATMGYGAVTALAHEMESLLDRVRQKERKVTPDLMDLLFKGADALERAIGRAVDGQGDDPGAAELAAVIRAQAAKSTHRVSGSVAAAEQTDEKPVAKRGSRRAAAAATPRVRRPAAKKGEITVRIRMKEGIALKGARAYLVVMKAEEMGELISSEPSVEALQREEFERDFTLRLAAKATPGRVAEVLRGAGDVESVNIESDAKAAPKGVPAAPQYVPQGETRHVRIDLRRLDALMNLVGELVIARGQLQAMAGTSGDAALEETVAQGARLIGEMQEEILRCRMVPVAQVFDRFPRLVRDAARALGKEITFTVEGQESELDRSMLDEIGDPVMHLLRNAVDHGIEMPAERAAAGKPRAGTLTLSISRDRSAVMIRVTDDGRGIDRAKVLAKARSLGLVLSTVKTLPDEELFRLIARPGFTTAERVTNLSGRGVGIDVVSTRVRALGGSLEMRTAEGQGTTVTARLPLTLAIVRAMLARVGNETYAVPMTHVTETVELEQARVRTVRGYEALVLREDVLPLVRLRNRLSLAASAAPMQQIVVMEVGERRAALVVDELAGQQDIVVKQFDPVRGGMPLFSGATILSDGAPALILDVGSLL
jgi:two-component system chemotaxis sensor kinase CheA